jgi:uncharacterized membrane protein
MTDAAPGPSAARTEAFSDGVLAIAITLLILEIGVPDVGPDETLTHELLELWPKYVTFAVSFLTIGIIWINHHGLFDRIARVDRRTQLFNLLLLLSVSFVPFPTAVLGDYVRDGANGRAAAVLYGINMLAVGFCFLLLWWHLLQHPEVRAADFDDGAVRLSIKRTLVGPFAYSAGIVVSLVSAPAALVVYAAIAIYFAVGQISRSVPAGNGEPEAERR